MTSKRRRLLILLALCVVGWPAARAGWAGTISCTASVSPGEVPTASGRGALRLQGLSNSIIEGDAPAVRPVVAFAAESPQETDPLIPTRIQVIVRLSDGQARHADVSFSMLLTGTLTPSGPEFTAAIDPPRRREVVFGSSWGSVAVEPMGEAPGSPTLFAQLATRPVADVILASFPAPLTSAPTAVEGDAYVYSEGAVHAVSVPYGAPRPGFPAAVPITGRVLGRTAVYYGDDGLAAYVTSENGIVAKVNADGSLAWVVQPLGMSSTVDNVSTPAVTPEGHVYVGLAGAGGSVLVKLDNRDGALLRMSLLLGGPGSTISAPAVHGDYAYVGVTRGLTGDIVMLRTADLYPAGSAAFNEGVVAPPYIRAGETFYGTMDGGFYKINTVTLAPDPLFGDGGRVEVGEPLPTGPFAAPPPLPPAFFVATAYGRVVAVDPDTGALAAVYDAGNPDARVGNPVVSPGAGILAFGMSDGRFIQVPLLRPAEAMEVSGLGPADIAPSYDRASRRFVMATGSGILFAFPEIAP